MFLPEQVILLAFNPLRPGDAHFSLTLNRFEEEDPTFRVHAY